MDPTSHPCTESVVAESGASVEYPSPLTYIASTYEIPLNVHMIAARSVRRAMNGVDGSGIGMRELGCGMWLLLVLVWLDLQGKYG